MSHSSSTPSGQASQRHSEAKASLADYRAALSTPGVRGPMVASIFARLPIAMIGISAMLFEQRKSGLFGTAGLVSAAMLVGVACGSVIQGRLIDRFGPTRPLLMITGVFVAAAGGLLAGIELRAPTVVLLLLSGASGLSQPMVGSASRALWGRLVPPGSRRVAAYSYEAISMEVFFILGPGLAGLLVAAPWAGTGMLLGVVCMVGGAIAFATSRTVRTWGPSGATRQGGLLGVLAWPGMRMVVLAALGFGIVIGSVEVAVPGAATKAGHPTVGGLLLSVWSLSSVAFGVAYSMRPWPRPVLSRLPVLLALFGGLVALLAAPPVLWGLAIAMLAAGALITPQSTTHSTAIELVAPADKAAEAFGWVLTAITLGIAIGQAVGGALVDHQGPPMAFLVAGAGAVAIASAVWALRGPAARAVVPEA